MSHFQQQIPLTAFGDVRTAELSPIFQGSFEYTVDNTDLCENTKTGAATVTQADGMLVLSTTTTTGSTAKHNSKIHARYRAGLGGVLRFTALFTSPVAGTEQLCGLADETGSTAAFKNGYMVGYYGTDFGFHRFQNDAVTTVALEDWDDPLDGTGPSGMTLDPTKLNVFFVAFQYLGAGAIRLWVEDAATGDMINAHTILYANLNTSPSTHNPNFHAMYWVDNGATTSNIQLKAASYGYFIEGKTGNIEYHQPQNSSGIKTKNTVTSEVAILTIMVKSTYASKTNFIDIQLERIAASIEASAANNLGYIRLVKNATLGGSPSYSDINATNSVVEIDNSGTTVTGGTNILTTPLAGRNDKAIESLLDYKIILQAGDTLTISGVSTSSATINAAMLWKELF